MPSNYVRDERMQVACPSCGSGRIACVLGLQERLDFCMKCHRVWEPLPAGEPYTIDGEQLAFKIPCDNCAYRGNSVERQDPEGWRDLQQMLENGGEFYCHKGVPFSVVDPKAPGALVDAGDRGFEFPRKESSVDIGGECQPYQHYDKDRMRLCRGYLNAHIGQLLKKVLADA